jgi:tetratricopeptide (TPR) repeat protein
MNPQVGFLLNKSLDALRSSNLDSAELILNQALKIQSNNATVLRLLGVVASQKGEFSRALKYINDALKYSPRDFLLLSNLGNIFYELKDYESSLIAYEKSIKLNPNYEEVWSNKGNLLRSMKQYEEALICHDKAINSKPNYPEAWNNKGNVLHDLGRHEEALGCYDKAINLTPSYADAWNNKGNVLRSLGRCDEALFNHNNALKFAENHPQFLANKGLTLNELRKYREEIEQYDKALNLQPDFEEVYANKGLALHELGRYEEAIEQYDSALNLNPTLYEAWKNKGVSLHDLSRCNEALVCYENALKIKPNSFEVNWNKSLTLLLQGDFDRGLPLYENRWKSNNIGSEKDYRFEGVARWTGAESLKNKTILVFGEQGFGDFIQFCRYIRLLPELGAKVILEAPEQLFELMKSVDSSCQLVVKGKELPPFDYCCPVMSLPLATGVNLSNIKVYDPYILSNSKKVADWNERLGKKLKIRIGIAWSSMSGFKDDSKRSLPLELFLNGLPSDTYDYVCLQKEIKDTDRETLRNYGKINFYGDELNNFSDTAALIECVDLVISTCTSIPHLSGALGKKTWIILPYTPDWRWFLNRTDSPWYPSVKLFRQSDVGDWNSVLSRVKKELEALNYNSI